MKPIPPGMTFRDALIRGYTGRIESGVYLDFVRSLPCVCCGSTHDIVAHHPIDCGFKGLGSKVPDFWAIPLTPHCHDALHRNVAMWEERHGSQFEHAVLTMTQFLVYEAHDDSWH